MSVVHSCTANRPFVSMSAIWSFVLLYLTDIVQSWLIRSNNHVQINTMYACDMTHTLTSALDNNFDRLLQWFHRRTGQAEKPDCLEEFSQHYEVLVVCDRRSANVVFQREVLFSRGGRFWIDLPLHALHIGELGRPLHAESGHPVIVTSGSALL